MNTATITKKQSSVSSSSSSPSNDNDEDVSFTSDDDYDEQQQHQGILSSEDGRSSDDDDSEEENEVITNTTATTTWRINRSNNKSINKIQPSLEDNLWKRQQQGIKTIIKRRQDNDDNTDDGNNDEEKKRSTKNSKSKHAPTEVSSKKRDFYSRQQNTTSLGSRGINFEAAGIVHHYKPRDPRSMIDGSSGSKRIDEEYEFLDDIMKTEMDTLKQRIAARKATGRQGKKARRKLNICNTGSLEEDQQKLKQLKEQLTQRQRAAAQRAAKVTLKRRMEQDIAEGKTGAYYLKRKERRKLELEATFEELRKRGGDNAINKAMAKRRKKNASKDHKYIPRSEPT